MSVLTRGRAATTSSERPRVERGRVVHAVHCWLPGYGEWLYNLVTGTAAELEASVVCDTLAYAERFPFPRAYAAAASPRRFLVDRALRRSGLRRHRSLLATVLAQEAREAEGATLLHSHFAQTGWANARLARRLSLPHLVSCYGEDMTMVPRSSKRWRRRYADMFASIDALLCEGPHMAEIVAWLGCPPARIRLHPLGIDLEQIPFRPRVQQGPLRVLMAATFREKKGLRFALEALGELRRRGVAFEATLVGDSRPGDKPTEKRALEALIGRHELEGRLTRVGLVSHPELLALAARHDVFLSPSVVAADGDAEGGAPVAIIEMAASGMPVVSTRHCDIPFVLGEPNRALLVRERDAEALADVLASLDGADWSELTAANREHIAAQHDARRQARALVALYRELAPW